MRATKKAFNTLTLTKAHKVDNVYGLLHDMADDWFARVRLLHGGQLTWDVFKVEFCREYLTDAFKAEK